MNTLRSYGLLLVFFSSVLAALGNDEFSNKVNLALRQTGHSLMLLDGDSTTAIPPIEQNGPHEYVLQMNKGFDYSQLPDYLGRAFKDFGIHQPYEVMVRSCETNFLVLGFNKAAAERDSVACRDRGNDLVCSTIHIQFAQQSQKEEKSLISLAWLLIPVVGIGGVLLFRKKDTTPIEEREKDGLKLGNYQLNPQNQKLAVGDQEYDLTFRECKLLHYLAAHPNEVLTRDAIMAAVWEDEGIVVGRSLDVFISRLRKMLKSDASISIKTVHGVGYRLEIQN